MDKDRIAGSAKDFAGKVERPAGDITGNAQTQAPGRAREAAGAVQNLYGQAKDAARDAGDAAVSYAKDAYDNSGETLRDGSQAVAKKVQDNPLGALLVAAGIGFALALMLTRPPRRRAHHHEDFPACRSKKVYRSKKPGTEAERPTLPGGRGAAGARGGGW